MEKIRDRCDVDEIRGHCRDIMKKASDGLLDYKILKDSYDDRENEIKKFEQILSQTEGENNGLKKKIEELKKDKERQKIAKQSQEELLTSLQQQVLPITEEKATNTDDVGFDWDRAWRIYEECDELDHIHGEKAVLIRQKDVHTHHFQLFILLILCFDLRN